LFSIYQDSSASQRLNSIDKKNSQII